MNNHIIVYLIVFCILASVAAGCAVPTVPKQHWEATSWHVQQQSGGIAEIGILQDEQFTYDIVVVDLRKVMKNWDYSRGEVAEVKQPPTLIVVVIKCRNKSNGTLILSEDPIQMITLSASLAKKLTREEVIFKLYGGRMQEASKIAELESLNQPIHTSDTFFGAVLAGIIEAQKADARQGIINEMFEKEYTAYEIFHESFKKSSLPPGISYDWIQYYPYTQGPISIILQGQNVQQGIAYKVPPTPPPTPEEIAAIQQAKKEKQIEQIGLTVTGILAFAFIIIMMSRTYQ